MFWEETVFLFHRFARAQAIAYALNNLAWVARADGDLEQAQATLDDALARFRRMEDRRGEALTQAHMGNLSRSQGDFEAARASGRGAHDPPRPRRSPRRPQHADRPRPVGHDGR
jgi:hypothetical protein